MGQGLKSTSINPT